MADDLKQSVLNQLALPPLQFSVEPGDLPPKFAQALQVRVTEVFGTAPEVEYGCNYLVSGDYLLLEPVVETMVLATSGRMTGYHQPLSPGPHSFALYGHAWEMNEADVRTLSIRIFDGDDSYAVLHIRLPAGDKS
ncbi:MAG: hypothetical protein ACYDCO_20400 [Armatimonadota bacterium]